MKGQKTDERINRFKQTSVSNNNGNLLDKDACKREITKKNGDVALMNRDKERKMKKERHASLDNFSSDESFVVDDEDSLSHGISNPRTPKRMSTSGARVGTPSKNKGQRIRDKPSSKSQTPAKEDLLIQKKRGPIKIQTKSTLLVNEIILTDSICYSEFSKEFNLHMDDLVKRSYKHMSSPDSLCYECWLWIKIIIFPFIYKFKYNFRSLFTKSKTTRHKDSGHQWITSGHFSSTKSFLELCAHLQLVKV
jgi:hypothetical protein